jgi:hypothetical protein
MGTLYLVTRVTETRRYFLRRHTKPHLPLALRHVHRWTRSNWYQAPHKHNNCPWQGAREK